MSKKVTYKDFQILSLVPQKGKISTTQILDKLNQKGFELTARTLQRDLNNLAEFFEIQSDNNADTPGWSWKKDVTKLELPSMSPDVALTFKMTENYLQKFMPISILQSLQPYLKQADKVLRNLDNKVSNWQNKINTTSRRMPLIAPKIKPEILENIYSALLDGKQISAIYKPIGRGKKEYNLHPLGVVIVDEVLYLLATLWDYDDVKQFSLHRFINVEKTTKNTNTIQDFSLDKYIENGKFLFPSDEKSIDLVLKVNDYLAKHLGESRLSKNQKITQESEGIYKITATIKPTTQLNWWILSMGSDVEVIAPKKLRDNIAKSVEKSNFNYKNKP